MPDRETWQFINTFAPWVSAVGTLAAVVVSLYLARRSGRPRIRVSAAVVRTMTPGRPTTDSREYFQIRAVNSGFREVVISGIMWKQLGWRKQSYVVLPPDDPYSTRLPARLQHGDQAHFFFPTETFPRLGSSLLKTLVGSTASSLRPRLIRVGVYASTGEEFLARLDEHMRKWLVRQSEESRPNTAYMDSSRTSVRNDDHVDD